MCSLNYRLVSNTATAGSEPRLGPVLDGRLYFAATALDTGTELWRTDGTTAGTELVLELGPGAESSSPKWIVERDGTLLFTATTSETGTELWKSNGTAEGTTLVADIDPGGASSDPERLTVAGNLLFFRACAGVSGCELWRSDGTAAGTFLVADLTPGPDPTFLINLANAGGILYFTTHDGLWRSDGTAQGTWQVSPVAGFDLIGVGDRVFFRHCPLGGGCELWTSDGTTDGTVRLLGTRPEDPGTRRVAGFAAIRGMLYFGSSFSRTGPTELWRTDGSPVGTEKLLETPRWLPSPEIAAAGDTIFFAACLGGCELWRTDGTPEGAALIARAPGLPNPTIWQLTPVGDTIFYRGCDGESCRFWQSDGTPDGTRPLTDDSLVDPREFRELNGTLLFTAFGLRTGRELWRHLASCGNGTLNPGEECDEGLRNGAVTASCSLACQEEVPAPTTSSTTTSTSLPHSTSTTTPVLCGAGIARCSDGDACTVDTCDPATGRCRHERARASSPTALTCLVESIRAVLNGANRPACTGRCRCNLERTIEGIAQLVGAATEAARPGKCRVLMRRVQAKARRLARRVDHLRRADCVVPVSAAVDLVQHARQLRKQAEKARHAGLCSSQ